MSSLVTDPPGTPVTPCVIKKGEERRKKRREVFHLFRCYTPTHTRPEPGQPWKARGRKKRTQTTGKRPKQRRGGRGTNGPPEPTYAAKRTWPKQSTHLKPHDTLRRGVVRYSLAGTVVRSAQRAYNSCSNSIELGAHNMINLTRKPPEGKNTTRKAMYLPDHCVVS